MKKIYVLAMVTILIGSGSTAAFARDRHTTAPVPPIYGPDRHRGPIDPVPPPIPPPDSNDLGN